MGKEAARWVLGLLGKWQKRKTEEEKTGPACEKHSAKIKK